jgi:hypothetical protein
VFIVPSLLLSSLMVNQVCLVAVASSLGLIFSYLADDPKDVIITVARHLDHQQARHGCFGVQFMQIGDDPDATEEGRWTMTFQSCTESGSIVIISDPPMC